MSTLENSLPPSGWIIDEPDERDKLYTSLHEQMYGSMASEEAEETGELYIKNQDGKEIILPNVDLRKKFYFDVYDQGPIGSCTANAIAAALRFGRSQKENYAPLNFHPSRMFIYYNERRMAEVNISEEDRIEIDSGARLRDGIKSLLRYGVCSEMKDWEYVPVRADEKTKKWPKNAKPCLPFPTCDIKQFFDDAHVAKWKDYLGTSFTYYRIEHKDNNIKLLQIKAALSSGFPVIFGFNMYWKDQIDPRTMKNGVMRDPAALKRIGGHAVIAVGYNEENLIIRNSWGVAFGGRAFDNDELAGHFYMPYKWITEKNGQMNHADDFWLLQIHL